MVKNLNTPKKTTPQKNMVFTTLEICRNLCLFEGEKMVKISGKKIPTQPPNR